MSEHKEGKTQRKEDKKCKEKSNSEGRMQNRKRKGKEKIKK